tara:strand:- start:2842 stop:3477 length:636 start_codon:yes stop_codon:yes gene_type:complete
MASTYTSNTGIEKPGTGEQSGTWGTTTNTNFDIIDRALNGVGAITLSGTTHTLTTSDGSLSDGGYKVLILGGSPSGTNTITISPNDAAKVYLVNNGTNQTATFTQGSGGNVSIAAGASAWIYADGAGSGAEVRILPADLVGDTTPQLGGNLDTNNNAILFAGANGDTSKWAISLDTGDNDLLFKYNGTTVFKISSAGAVVAADNITAHGSP